MNKFIKKKKTENERFESILKELDGEKKEPSNLIPGMVNQAKNTIESEDDKSDESKADEDMESEEEIASEEEPVKKHNRPNLFGTGKGDAIHIVIAVGKSRQKKVK